jgi:hypothetical protein
MGTDEALDSALRFRQYYFDHDRGIYRAGFIVLTIPCLFFAWSDYLLFQTSGMFFALIAARLAVFAATLVALVLLSRIQSHRNADRLVTSWCLAVCALNFFINWTRPPDYIQHSVLDVLILMTMYFLFPLPLPRQALAPLVFTSGNLVIIYAFKNPMGPIQANVLWVSYILANALGIFTAERLQRYRLGYFDVLHEERALRRELEEASNNLKTLRGMLPICAHCKKVRDDQGYWTQIEQYIRARSEAEFSHGICPECFAEHYEDLERQA